MLFDIQFGNSIYYGIRVTNYVIQYRNFKHDFVEGLLDSAIVVPGVVELEVLVRFLIISVKESI